MTNLRTQDVVPSNPSYRFIPLTKNQIAVVDAADYEWLNQWKWCAHGVRGHIYAQRGQKPVVLMHKLIAQTPPNMICDHWNGDTLDNRRVNLRNVTYGQNNRNRPLLTESASGHMGIFPTPQGGFRVRFTRNGKREHFGTFKTFAEALERRNQVCGKFSRRNCPEIVARPEFIVVDRPTLQAKNTSGITGISRLGKGWRVSLNLSGDGKQQYLGYFPDFATAVAERNKVLQNHASSSSGSIGPICC